MSEVHFVRGALILKPSKEIWAVFVKSVFRDTEEFILGIEKQKGEGQQWLQYAFSTQ